MSVSLQRPWGNGHPQVWGGGNVGNSKGPDVVLAPVLSLFGFLPPTAEEVGEQHFLQCPCRRGCSCCGASMRPDSRSPEGSNCIPRQLAQRPARLPGDPRGRGPGQSWVTPSCPLKFFPGCPSRPLLSSSRALPSCSSCGRPGPRACRRH